MEVWDVYNEKREKLCKTILRGGDLVKGEYHLVVHIWIINSENKLLIQRRSSNVKRHPNLWATTGGAVLSGENSFEACKREAYEEIGVKLDMNSGKVFMTQKREDSLCDVWVIKQEVDIEQCKLQIEEVSEVKWIAINEYRDMMKDDSAFLYNYFEELVKTIEGDE